MKKFINLFTDEVNRNTSFNVVFIVLLILLELLAIFLKIFQSMNSGEEIYLTSLTIDNKYFIMVISFAIFGVIVFTWFSWFREWYLQGRYIYRLMLLPGSRIPIAWAKWASIIFQVLILVGVQILMLSAIDSLCELFLKEYASFGWKNTLVMDMGGINFLLPINFGSFIGLFSFVSIFILCISNLQLIFLSNFSRSRVKAVIYAIIYVVISIGAFVVVASFLVINLNVSDYERGVVIVIFFLVYSLVQGIWMTYFTQRHLSI